ncbi:protein-glucosylgalactosylhydroxylysine glucosidase-like [Mizuhopecten yessoensis]|uniref:Protein-glucosylgalactosylhydroxylysine glucosidase n=1 Tax=Mizuhopecten yessoensis TaxID=6573 RepID=A0A210PKW2_MIZYE|nr:protein-glucosylgalactosylhydroxylysine glucosidase-like [Mizuhopecten yessoensis]OWF37122.1 Acid trehalase-like protein 1 [Mizuhopecten yessoensis]
MNNINGRMVLIVLAFLSLDIGISLGNGTNNTEEADHHDDHVTLWHGPSTVIIKDTKRPYPAFLDQDVTILSVDSLPDAASMPTIGNGYLATLVHSDTMYMNGVYNGPNGTSHRARLRSTSSINITDFSFPVTGRKYSLDVGRGMYIEEYTSDDVRVEMNMYAHQLLNRLLVTEISVVNNGHLSVHMNLSQNIGLPSEDLSFQTADREVISQFRKDYGNTNEAEFDTAGTIPLVSLSTWVPDTITVEAGGNVRYLFQTCVQPYENGEYFMKGIDYFFNGTLRSSHEQKWEEIWRKGRIDMDGDVNISRINYAALYYLLSEVPRDESYGPFLGISPGGLAHGALHKDYQGHIFWDQETWMFPPILALHSDKGKKVLETRIKKHASAKQIAKLRGYEGAMYPWESAYTGLEVCPLAQYSDYEQHITGDIALAFKQYVMMTRDKHFLDSEGAADVITDIASFWMSRMTYNQDEDRYEINDVMPPDEYHYPVNNSVYTNSVAKISLLLPKYALPLINRKPDPRFEDIANKTFIPFNDTGKWHPEYDGYTQDETVKQADVVLLGFPLMVDLSEEIRKNDLEIYEKVTPGGPAMTWGMFAIGWLELNEIAKAERLFKKQFINVVPPFNIWSEVENGGGARNFLTGIGGYLQSLIFGYGGFRIFEDRLQFDPTLPPDISTFNLTGIDYLDGSFDFHFAETHMSVKQTKVAMGAMNLTVTSSGQTETLDVGVWVQYPRDKAYLVLG